MDMEEVAQLQQIFPAWDQESLLALLQANGMNMDRTVEAIFIIESAKENGGEIIVEDVASEPLPPQRPAQNRQKPVATEREFLENEFYRGLRIKLPDDFLRPPNYAQKSLVDRDEQLALMLQNELFAEQLNSLNRNYDPTMAGHPGRGANRNRSRGGSGAEDDAIPDLGIMKTLTSMGKMASSFASSLTAPATRTQGGGAQQQGRANQQELRSFDTATETNPLVANRDDEDEVISFDDVNRRNGHVLEGDTYRRRSDNKKDT